MSIPERIKNLTQTFHYNLDSYKKGNYNETQVRREFIDPFFEELGWDIANKQGYAEAYKDVIHEDSIKVGGVTKAPDYCFRIGGSRKFFLEAKKPAVNIKEDIHPAYQLRRYGWSAKLPLSILTDFEEFAVYDCRVKPAKTHKASHSRILYLKYTDYAEKWDEIANIFSREAVLKGSFDKYADSNKSRRGTAEVDAVFLQEIEQWRELLAQNIALRNSKLSQRELNFAVQQTIDRIVFLRICEDRGIENYGSLMALQKGENVYIRLFALFTKADAKYNSGLFHFRKEKNRENFDHLTPKLSVDDNVLKNIFKNLYYPDSPYEFSVLPADILGHVYEKFLGKVIRLTPKHQAVIEEKPEVRKAGGVYYTPTYIVDYIVRNTVKKLLEGKKPGNAKNIRILDPACGSGSFLIGAYQFLLDWYLTQYVSDNPEKKAKGKKPLLYQTDTGDWRLTTEERKRILISHIYGVDIDSQAVEVTKLSLLLKVLEGENEQSLQMSVFQERVLPDLSNNIKCGNSLIGPDFYENQQIKPEEEEIYKVNAFDWNAEFAEIMKSGRFDAVIGNPPYGYMLPDNQQEYFLKCYHHQNYQKDYYLLFLERYAFLLKNNGLLGVIISNTWLQSLTFRRIREYLTANYSWLRILHLPEKVFDAVVDTHAVIFQNTKDGNEKNETVNVDVRKGVSIIQSHTLSWQNIPKNGDPVNIVASDEKFQLFHKIAALCIPLAKICNIYNGVKPFEKGKGKPPQTEKTMKEKPYVREGTQPDAEWKPLLRGSLIHRYKTLWNHNYWILYGEWLAAPRNPSIFEAPEKIMVRQTGDSIIATLAEKGFVGRNNLHIILPFNKDYHLNCVLGIMNSRLMDFVYTVMNPEKGEALAEIKKKHIEQLPIPPVKLDSPKNKSLHGQMVSLVGIMLDLHKKHNESALPQEKTVLQRQIEATDRQIDQLVYKLYGLTDKEIKIVEGKTGALSGLKL